MPSDRSVSATSSAANNAHGGKQSPGLWAGWAGWADWAGWAGAAKRNLTAYILDLFKSIPPAESALSTSSALDNAASGHKMIEQKTVEKVYRINDRGRVLKRSLRQDEYCIRNNGEPFIPWLVVERLKNEAACMTFLRKNTHIPVPTLLDTYEENGCYYLWMEFVSGVEMSKLTNEEQSKVIPQVQDIVDTLQTIRFDVSGGPTGILAPPSFVYFYHFSDFQSRKGDYVFCHGDLSQNNIMVDPKSLRIVAIIDWEYGGFYPKEHEIPFYRSPEFSGKQIRDTKFEFAIDSIIEFWRQSQASTS